MEQPKPKPMIGLFEALYTSRALRRLKPDPIPDEILFQLLDVAIRAPTGQIAQDWRFVVITDAAVKQHLQTWSEEGWKKYQARYVENPALIDELPRTQRLSLRSVEHLVYHLAESPVILAVCGMRGRHSTPGGSIFPAVQNLLLAARAFGLGGSIFNLPLSHVDELMEMLGIPDNNEVLCLIPLGYTPDKTGPVRRKPVKKVVSWERWGEAWEFAEEQPDGGWGERWIGKSEGE